MWGQWGHRGLKGPEKKCTQRQSQGEHTEAVLALKMEAGAPAGVAWPWEAGNRRSGPPELELEEQPRPALAWAASSGNPRGPLACRTLRPQPGVPLATALEAIVMAAWGGDARWAQRHPRAPALESPCGRVF